MKKRAPKKFDKPFIMKNARSVSLVYCLPRCLTDAEMSLLTSQGLDELEKSMTIPRAGDRVRNTKTNQFGVVIAVHSAKRPKGPGVTVQICPETWEAGAWEFAKKTPRTNRDRGCW